MPLPEDSPTGKLRFATSANTSAAPASWGSAPSSVAAINIYADESKNDDFYFLSLVYVSPSHQHFWAEEVRALLEKEGLPELHGQRLGSDGPTQRCACSLLARLNLRGKPGKYRDHPLGFCVLGIRRDRQREKLFFGGDQRESNMHRRFLRAAIKYSLKKFFAMSGDNKLVLFHLYHDESSQLEQNELLISRWMMDELASDCEFQLEPSAKRVEFIPSDAGRSGAEASYLIQIADLLGWLVQRGTRRAPSGSRQPDFHLSRLLDVWQRQFLPVLLLAGEELRDPRLYPDERARLTALFRLCHLSFFPDGQGRFYKPSPGDFRY